MMNPFVFVCAGEDSGDILGESVLSVLSEFNLEARGIGGPRMKARGLRTVESYEKFPVSGFLDVIRHIPFFLKFLALAKKEIANPACKALIAIDYPGVNLKLVKLAKKYNKPVFYLSPPQIFAWKKNRGKLLKGTTPCVFFSIEEDAYYMQKVPVVKGIHPFANFLKDKDFPRKENDKILFFPGSRYKVLQRNLKTYEKTATILSKLGTPVFVASRNSLYQEIKKLLPKYQVLLMPPSLTEKAELFSSAKLVVGCPGTSLLEATLCKVPVMALFLPDFLTYCFGKLFLKIPYFTLPNIILDKFLFPEIILSPFTSNKKLFEMLPQKVNDMLSQKDKILKSQKEIQQKVLEGTPIEILISEFLMKFVARKSH